MNFLMGMLGVKRTTTSWAVLRECGHEPLQFYLFRSVVSCVIACSSQTVRH